MLKGRKRVGGPSSRVVIWTSLLLTAKWTSAPLGKDSSGSASGLWAGMAVEAILVDGVLNALREIGLQLDRRDRQAIEKQHEVDGVLVRRRIADLPDDAQAVGGVTRQNIGVHRQRRFELRERERVPKADNLDAMPQHVERAPVIELFADAIEQDALGGCAVVLSQRLPCLGLCGFNPGDEIGREQSAGAVIAGGVAFS